MVCFMVTRSQGGDLLWQIFVSEINSPSGKHCLSFVTNLKGVTRAFSQARGEAFSELKEGLFVALAGLINPLTVRCNNELVLVPWRFFFFFFLPKAPFSMS